MGLPVIVTQYALEPGQDPHFLKGFHASFFMGIIKGPKIVGNTVQPKPVTALIDAGFIG